MFHRRLHPVTPGAQREGLTEKAPILLENISPEDFEKLLWVFYNSYVASFCFSHLFNVSLPKTLFDI
jgi:hypothetical protein